MPMSRMNGRVRRVQRARPPEESENDSKYARARVLFLAGGFSFLSARATAVVTESSTEVHLT